MIHWLFYLFTSERAFVELVGTMEETSYLLHWESRRSRDWVCAGPLFLLSSYRTYSVSHAVDRKRKSSSPGGHLSHLQLGSERTEIWGSPTGQLLPYLVRNKEIPMITSNRKRPIEVHEGKCILTSTDERSQSVLCG